MLLKRIFLCITFFSAGIGAVAQGAEIVSADVEKGLHQAVAFFREQVSIQGGYLWRYTSDLARREGEGKASETMAWVQPPGTPSVGMAFLKLYKQTGDRYYLEAAVESAHALVKGQLQSGGWDYRIEFDHGRRKEYAYRSDGRTDGFNTTTLDDDTTQSAMGFLMRVDQALHCGDQSIHEAVCYGLDALLKAQYPNGAWPQRYSSFPDPDRFPVKKAEYPESWSRTYSKHDYAGYYTLNDNTLADAIEMMFLATEIYGDERYRASAIRGGDFILLAQMPDPQPAWAQQYDFDMHPAWARKFEPPAVTGGESQGVLRMLLGLYAKTGYTRYLDAVGPALDYLKKSRLPDGRLARFYELKTNTPLYFTKTYELTRSSDDMPTHYGFITEWGLDTVESDYRKARERAWTPPSSVETAHPKDQPAEKGVRAVLSALDERGAWVEPGKLRYHGEDDPAREVIDAATFVRNVGILGAFLADKKR